MTDTTAPANSIEDLVARALYATEWDGSEMANIFDQETVASRAYWLRSARAAIAAYKKAINDER